MSGWAASKCTICYPVTLSVTLIFWTIPYFWQSIRGLLSSQFLFLHLSVIWASSLKMQLIWKQADLFFLYIYIFEALAVLFHEECFYGHFPLIHWPLFCNCPGEVLSNFFFPFSLLLRFTFQTSFHEIKRTWRGLCIPVIPKAQLLVFRFHILPHENNNFSWLQSNCLSQEGRTIKYTG